MADRRFAGNHGEQLIEDLGRILQVTLPEGNYKRPNSMLVADFICQANFICDQRHGTEAHVTIDLAGSVVIRAMLLMVCNRPWRRAGKRSTFADEFNDRRPCLTLNAP